MSTKVEFSTGTSLFVLDNLIKKDGYKPKSKFGGECTAFVAEEELRNDGNHFASLSISDRVIHLNERICKIIQAKHTSDFHENCRDAVGLMEADGSWKLKQKIFNYQLGWLAALVHNVIRDEDRPAKEDLSHLGYIGKQGKRGKFFVKLIDVISKDDYKIHRVHDRAGNRGHFYNYQFDRASAPSDDYPLRLNDCFLMTATPVRHEINKYDGGKNTYFNRIKIEENKGKSE
jgi:hypothetical protein